MAAADLPCTLLHLRCAPGAAADRVHVCRRRSKHQDSYRTYLHRTLKSVHPDLGISQKAMDIADSMMHDMYDRITAEAARLLRITGVHDC